jgi:hypothetical protein
VVAEGRAPDGYQLETRSQSGPGLVGELFGMRRYRATAALVNRGRVVLVELPSSRFLYPSSVRSVAWVQAEEQR